MQRWYCSRPAPIDREKGAVTFEACRRYAAKASDAKHRIPDSLSFDRVIEDKTRSPTSLADFLNYSQHVSRDAENLEFLLWLKDYIRRFHDLPWDEATLSPVWTPDMQTTMKMHSGKEQLSPVVLTFQEAFERSQPILDDLAQAQPFRADVNLIIQNYLLVGAPRELNLPYRVRDPVLKALAATTHPSAFQPCRDLVEQCLRHQSHPNFIWWALGSEGHRETSRPIICRILWIFTFLFFVVGEVLLIASGRSRWLRITFSPLLFSALLQAQSVMHGVGIVPLWSRSAPADTSRIWDPFAGQEEMRAAEELTTPPGILFTPTKNEFGVNTKRYGARFSTITSEMFEMAWTEASTLVQTNHVEKRQDDMYSDDPFGDEQPPRLHPVARALHTDSAVAKFRSRLFWQSVGVSAAVTVVFIVGLVAIPVTHAF